MNTQRPTFSPLSSSPLSASPLATSALAPSLIAWSPSAMSPPPSSPIASSFADLSDADLLATVTRLARCEAQATADLVASLAEVDLRRLYLEQGFSSLFAYCVQHLHLGEGATANRIEAARAARRFPLILERLRTGSVTLTAIRLLAPHLTEANHREVLDAAHHASRTRVEHLVAQLNPMPDVPSVVRKLPARRISTGQSVTALSGNPGDHGLTEQPLASGSSTTATADMHESSRRPPSGSVRPQATATDPVLASRSHVRATASLAEASATGSTGADTVPLSALDSASMASSASRPVEAATANLRPRPSALVAPLAPERYKVQMTVGHQTYAKLRRAQDLLRHTIPNGDVAEIFDQALTLLVEHLERRKLGAAKRPRPAKGESPSGSKKGAKLRKPSRHIPAAVKREVWRRDAGRCSYVAASGQRCGETGFLEYHHRRPVGDGGETTVENTALYCRVHNQREGERYFGFTREPIAAMVAAASRGDDAGGHDQNDGAREHVSKHARESAVAPTQDPRKSSASGP